jgi:hypothetical protein
MILVLEITSRFLRQMMGLSAFDSNLLFFGSL